VRGIRSILIALTIVSLTSFKRAECISLVSSHDELQYDAIIVGGGLAGLSTALYLSDQGKRVLILEKNDFVGGLASHDTTADGLTHSRAAAYWSSPDKRWQKKLFERLGIGESTDRFRIYRPSDSFLYKGKMYRHIWGKEFLAEAPPNFQLFLEELMRADDRNLIPIHPIEDAKNLTMDDWTAEEWIRNMPVALKRRTSPEAKALYKKIMSDPRISEDDPMRAVLDLIDVYTRSALGLSVGEVSALALANFYMSEVEDRFTSTKATGEIVERILNILKSRSKLVEIRTGVTASSVQPREEGGTVTSEDIHSKVARIDHAKSVVMALPPKVSAKLVKNFSQIASDKVEAIESIRYTPYLIHQVWVRNYPKDAGYDVWIHDGEYQVGEPTDAIATQWMDPKHHYDSEVTLINLYQPLVEEKETPSKERIEELRKIAISSFLRIYNESPNQRVPLTVEKFQSIFWKDAIHQVRPGFFRKIQSLSQPVGDIYFASSTLGLPSVEEAMYRGYRAAKAIILKERLARSQQNCGDSVEALASLSH